jgi:hypothetical protein
MAWGPLFTCTDRLGLFELASKTAGGKSLPPNARRHVRETRGCGGSPACGAGGTGVGTGALPPGQSRRDARSTRGVACGLTRHNCGVWFWHTPTLWTQEPGAQCPGAQRPARASDVGPWYLAACGPSDLMHTAHNLVQSITFSVRQACQPGVGGGHRHARRGRPSARGCVPTSSGSRSLGRGAEAGAQLNTSPPPRLGTAHARHPA